MCRVSGFWDLSFENGYDLIHIIENMRDTMKNGGPDDFGCFVDSENGLALGHRRLSIIDITSGGHQPMISDDKRFSLIYNGECYNYVELKKVLQDSGERFRTNSDSEVVLKCFEKYGVEAFSMIRGMFSLAIWDSKDKKLYLARDRAGIKPMYWGFDNKLFIFGSELRSFLEHPGFNKKISVKAISEYLHFGYVSLSDAIYENTHKLLPGHFLEIDKDNNINIKPFINNEKKIKNSNDIFSVLEESITLRMRSDVPVGVFLSGGIDSSLIASILRKNNFEFETYTIGFKEQEYDESFFAKKISEHLNIKNNVKILSIYDMPEIFEEAVSCFSEPFGDSSAIPTYILSRFSSKDCKVVLSGDGGDEVFAGYDRYRYTGMFGNTVIFNLIKSIHYMTKLIGKDQIFKFVQNRLRNNPRILNRFFKLYRLLNSSDVFNGYNRLMSIFTIEELKHLGYILSSLDSDKSVKGFYNIVRFLQVQDMNYYLPGDLLTKVDRTSMNFGLEVREPFLDSELIEKAFSINRREFIDYRSGKLFLKKELNKLLPNALWKRPKRGFGVPLDKWFKKDFNILSKKYIPIFNDFSELINFEEIQKIFSGYEKGLISSAKIYLLMALGEWLKKQ